MPRRKTPSPAGTADPLASLSVIERLEVGPVEVERRRLTMPYTVLREGVEPARNTLVYKFEQDVFDADDPASVNLAAMIGVQVALNYGLFCREIVFHDALDSHDRAFIEEFAANTAREIYVNKFLLPNPFLVGEAAGLTAVRVGRYLRARLRFPRALRARRKVEPWATDRGRDAVLSSGGKDSLLTAALLDELGVDQHAIFLNESGRHWYTALNAYREMATTRSNTHRVWTNSDRMFTWMLRHLPFVRPDHARLRADDYPIRLWTVAVFLFGSLPLLRKHGVARLLIGDEYDTSVRRRHRGIPHYAGLFDQSRWFDQAMSRYFAQKQWGISQFSILRPLSELLIEKILVERYPSWQRNQLSCHAASLKGERVVPCGRCEKCRRIVGMLVALGADPRGCGYTASQIDSALESLSRHGVHQEAAGAVQMRRMLAARGLWHGIEPPGETTHPEVLQVRFHPEISPPESIPPDLRERLWRIFLKHADGAVTRERRAWVAFDPLTESVLTRPYPFEDGTAAVPTGESKQRPRASAPYLLAEMNWHEAKARLAETDIALLPVGAIEQHGPHLPLDTDAYDADYLARRVAAACGAPKPLVLPLVPYGVSYHHDDFPGTLSVGPDTLARFVYEVGIGAARNGITKLIVINGHGGNGPSLHLAAQMINRDAGIFTCVDTGETSDHDIYSLLEAENDVHAGEIETSTTLAIRPELVHMDSAPKAVQRFSSRYLDFTSKRGVGWYARTAKISPSGVMGDATKATREKGEQIWALMTRRLVELIEDLQGLTLEEIHQTRY